MSDSLRSAIVIGNGAYQEGRLDNPTGDAQAIDGRLKEFGFETVFGCDLSRDEIFATMDNFRDRFPEAAVSLLFYAGHGLQHQGKNYLVPVEARMRRSADIARFGIDVDQFLELFEETASTSIVFLDCCRDSPFLDRILNSTRAEHRDLLPLKPGLANVDARNGTLIAYATSPNRTANDGTGEHSPFTTALLNRLGRPNESITDMMIDVTREVLELTNNRQCPWFHQSLWRKFVINPQEAALPPATSVGQDSDEAAWLAISASNSISVFDSFIQKHPTSTYSDHARARISQIRATAEAQQALASAGLPSNAQVSVIPIRPYDRSTVIPVEPIGGSRKPPGLGYRNMVHPAFLEGLVAIGLFSVAKVVTTDGRGIGTAYIVSGVDVFGPEDRGMYALTASHVVGSKEPAGFGVSPEEVLLSFEGMDDRGAATDPLRVTDVVWESEPWGRGCDATILGLGPDLPDFVRPIPIASGLPEIDLSSPLSFASRPRVVSISYPYGGGIRFGTIDNFLLDYDRPIFDENGQPVDRVIRLHHTAASEPGSSGCPILDEHLEVIGLHIGGADQVPRLNGQDGHYSANFGVWIQSIIKAAHR
ncbi:caspase family protein [Geodermatophilus sp. SYSU D00710]